MRSFFHIILFLILVIQDCRSREVRIPNFSRGLTRIQTGLKHLKGYINEVDVASLFSKINTFHDDCIEEVDSRAANLDKYIYLRNLQREKPETFYECVSSYMTKIVPIIYAPIVGKACKNFKTVVDSQKGAEVGLSLNIEDHMENMENELNKWKDSKEHVKLVVVTDGETTLGLGDLGANSMGIPEAKLALYTALGGLHQKYCLAVTLDVGTNNQDFLNRKKDKYVGKQMKRVTGERYNAFVDNFVRAVVKVFGRTTAIEFVGFATPNAIPLLKKYQNDYTVFSDDIQVSSTISFSGFLSAIKYRDTNINDAKVLIVGAKRAAFGISTLMLDAMKGSLEEKRRKIYMMDTHGLITSTRCPFKEGDVRKNFCHELVRGRETEKLSEIVMWLEPSMLIGLSGTSGIFTKEVLQNMVTVNKNNLNKCFIFPLSTKSECSTEDALQYAKECLIVRGSPWAPTYVDENTLGIMKTKKGLPAKNAISYGHKLPPMMQGNSDNIFPGVALGIVLAEMKKVPDHVFLIAAQTMAYKCLRKSDLNKGLLYPPLSNIRECSVEVAAAIVKYAFETDLSNIDSKPKGWEQWNILKYKNFVRERQYAPKVAKTSLLISRLQRLIKNECARQVDAKETVLDKYIYLRQMQATKESTFYKCLIQNVDKMLPIVYTPGVGKACKNYDRVVREGGNIGLTLNIEDDKNKIENRLIEWKKTQKEVKAIVVTDGERILGLGDLGANGMGIPVGKLALYTALGGVDPSVCLPVTLDVGTNNKDFLGRKQHKYVGKKKERVRGEEYWDFVDEFIQAVVKVYGRYTLIQFEDFATPIAQPLLEKYERRYTVFNDDIQGTAAVAVAGILAAAHFRNTKIDDAKVLFVGAGSAAMGISDLIVDAMTGSIEDNRRKIHMKDRYGLLTSKQCGNPEFEEGDKRRNFCHEVPEGVNVDDLAEIVLWLEPNVLIGVSATKGIFTKEVLQNMSKVNKKYNLPPIIMPLSNPTSRSECTAEEAQKYAPGSLFASGSPFAPVYVDEDTLKEENAIENENLEDKEESKGRKPKRPKGRLIKPMQCNNDNIFPGVALGIILAKMKTVPNRVFLIAAETLAYKCLKPKDFQNGSLYPQPKDLRRCSVKVAAAVVEYAFKQKDLSALEPKPKGWKEWKFENYEKFVRQNQYRP